MSGFDLSSVLPIYLDEVDEQIAGLNEILLRLEREPDDESLRDAFRLVHTVKGSSTMMGFVGVKELTHHLETFFDDLRSHARALDRPFLDLCFRSLDALRDYHRDLREGVPGGIDLSGLTAEVIAMLARRPSEAATIDHNPGPPEPEPPQVEGPVPELTQGVVLLTLAFEPNLPWPDMKARLVLNRLSAKGRVLATLPPAERLEEFPALAELKVWLLAEADLLDLHEAANVDGVSEVRIETQAGTGPEEIIESETTPSEPAVPVVADVRPAEAAPEETKRPRVAETVRVDADRLDRLMNLAGELVINKSRFLDIARGLDELFRASDATHLAADTQDRLEALARELGASDERARGGDESAQRWVAQLRRLRENFREIREELEVLRRGRERLAAMSEAIDQLSRVSDGLQRGVLETRMVPIGPLFERFHRVVRDLRLSSGKEVELRIAGEKTELDKRTVDELGDPLIHLVRNAVDHGLEPPDRREAAGKPRAGTVTLAASHRGNSVVVTVGDDGRGIDCEKVRRKAVARGLVAEAESRALPERQVIQYIWHPGLSTAESVTDISGRGVGMDIVKSRIEALNGTVDVRTEPGQGTTFTVRLPLTLAIMSVLLARVGEETYAIPLDHLDEIVEVGPGQIHGVRGQLTIEVRGRIISLVSLADVLGIRTASANGRPPARQTVIVVSNGEATLGLAVGELLGMQEAVLKSLERNFRPVAGLSGASILGDGRVALILDIDALIERAAVGVAAPVA